MIHFSSGALTAGMSCLRRLVRRVVEHDLNEDALQLALILQIVAIYLKSAHLTQSDRTIGCTHLIPILYSNPLCLITASLPLHYHFTCSLSTDIQDLVETYRLILIACSDRTAQVSNLSSFCFLISSSFPHGFHFGDIWECNLTAPVFDLCMASDLQRTDMTYPLDEYCQLNKAIYCNKTSHYRRSVFTGVPRRLTTFSSESWIC